MPGTDQELQRGIERVDHLHVARQGGRVGDRAERGVDIACLDGRDRHARVVDPEGSQLVSSWRSPVIGGGLWCSVAGEMAFSSCSVTAGW